MTQQEQLFSAKAKAERNHDYVHLFPGRVFPTGGIDVLERGGHLLFVKSYEHGSEMPSAQRRIWRRLSALSDPKHSTTVACVWGLSAWREFVVFTSDGETERVRTSRGAWRGFLADWWDSHGSTF